MKPGDIFYIQKAESEVDVFIYIIKGVHLSFGSITTDVFPKLKRVFKKEFYVDNSTSEKFFKRLKPEQRDIISIDEEVYRAAFQVLFNKDRYKK